MKVETNISSSDIRKIELDSVETSESANNVEKLPQTTLAEDVVEIGGGGGSWVPPSQE